MQKAETRLSAIFACQQSTQEDASSSNKYYCSNWLLETFPKTGLQKGSYVQQDAEINVSAKKPALCLHR